MKYPVILFLVTFCFLSCKKKNADAVPAQKLDSPVYNFFSGNIGANDLSAVFTNDGNIAVLGTGSGSILLYKLSQTGNQLLRKEIPLSGSSVSSFVQTPDNGFLICGTAYATSKDFFLLKVNSAGDVVWSKTYGSPFDDYGAYIIRTKDGNYVICGTTYGLNGMYISHNDIYLVKVNDNGDTLWSRSYPETYQQTPYHLLETQNGEYLVTGTNEPTNFERIIYMLKVSASGDKLWESNIGSTTDPSHYYHWGYCSAEATNGDLVVCGEYVSEIFVVRTDHNGKEIWEKTYYPGDTTWQGRCMSIKRDANNNFTMTGRSYYYMDASTSRCALLKIDNNGKKLFYNTFPAPNPTWGVNLLIGKNGDNMITGSQSLGINNTNIFFTRTDINGNYK